MYTCSSFSGIQGTFDSCFELYVESTNSENIPLNEFRTALLAGLVKADFVLKTTNKWSICHLKNALLSHSCLHSMKGSVIYIRMKSLKITFLTSLVIISLSLQLEPA